MKKETIEETAKYYAHNNFEMHETNNYKALKQGFEEGAKWQQERSYSEDDMRAAWTHGAVRSPIEFRHLNNFYTWFEQFKKK